MASLLRKLTFKEYLDAMKHQLPHLIIGVSVLTVLVPWAVIVMTPIFAAKNQLTEEQRNYLRDAGRQLHKMKEMCLDAGVDDLSDTYLTDKGEVVCTRYGGHKNKIVGLLSGEE